MSLLTELNEATFLPKLKSGLVLVDFWAPWCGPCRKMTPVLEELAAEYDGVEFCKVNTDEQANLTEKASVTALPTFILYRDGEAVASLVGAHTKAKFKEFLEKNI